MQDHKVDSAPPRKAWLAAPRTRSAAELARDALALSVVRAAARKRAPGGGRKPRDPEAGGTSNLSIRIHDREREQLEEQAEKRGVSIADVIRQDLTETGTFYEPETKPRKR